MASTLEVAEALAQANYLPQSAIQVAADMLAKSLTSQEAEESRAAALRDEAQQEGIITKASAFAEQDARMGNEKDLRVDEAIIQDAINQEQVDEAIIREAEHRISSACEAAADTLASAGLVDTSKVPVVAELIQKKLLNEE
jgi:hypothetical protein